MSMNVVVRTHGGLGNQLFQLLYARLYTKQCKGRLFELHDSRYAHRFARSSEISADPPPSSFSRWVSALRLPKVATRLGCRREALTVIDTVYVDGYFQHPEDYRCFDDAMVRTELQRFKTELHIPVEASLGRGMHLRLGDFFTSEAAIAAHLEERLQHVGANVGIVTNEEERLAVPAVASLLTRAGAHIVPTGEMTPEDVLRTLASFRQVDGNDSTLLFWASVLSDMRCTFRSAELGALRDRFSAILSDRPA